MASGRVSVRLDKKQLQRDVFVNGERIVKALLTPFVMTKIKAEQKQMVEEFEKHKVTQEIWAGNNFGAGEENSSSILGYGNLFSFIGFEEGSDPISPLSLILRERIDFAIKRTNDYGGYMVLMEIPSKEDLEEKAQVEWMGGRSWIDGIEHGIAGLNRYLYDEEGYGSPTPSKSDTGIQAKHKIRSVNFKAVPYVSKILNDFRKRLSRL